MTLFSLKPTESKDEVFLYELYRAVRKNEVDTWDWTEDQAEGFIQMQWLAQSRSYALQYPEAIRYIIQKDGQSIGQCYVHYDSDFMRLIDISIFPQWRGQGIGSTIIRNFLQEAQDRSISVCLSVTTVNPARRLYERLGFTINGATDMYVSMEWQPSNIILKGEGKEDE